MKTILFIYGIMSLVTLIAYAIDKNAARPESAPYQDLRLSASPRENSAAGEVVSRGGAETRRGGVCT